MDTERPISNPEGSDDAPTDARDTGDGVAFPTSDLPGTDHPETAPDQQGVKGVDPGAGSQAESEPDGA